MVNSFYAKGFRHWIGGEQPFGWDHIPQKDIYAPLAKHMASPLTVWYGPMVADENRVFEQMESFARLDDRSEEHTSELQSLMRISYAVFCLKKKTKTEKQVIIIKNRY